MSDIKITDSDYLYLSALISARENNMLNRQKLDRMIDVPAFADAAKLLAESGYPDMSGMDAGKIENALAEHRRGIFAEMQNLAPEPRIVEAFRLVYDYHNAKVLLKSESANVDGAYLLSDGGNIPIEKFLSAYHSEDFAFFPDELRNSVQEARSILQRTENPQLADFVLDKAYFEELKGIAEGASTAFFADYVAALADSANLRAAVRTERLGRRSDFLRKALVPGGSRGVETLLATVDSGSPLAEVYFGTPFANAAEKGDNVQHGGSLSEFELACDNAVTSFLRGANRVGFGAAKLVAYLAAVENEITAVRMVLTGKLSGVSAEKLRERLRETYA